MRWFVLAFAGCSGPSGDDGKDGDTDGGVGDSSGLVWVDAEGEVVGPVAYIADSDGYSEPSYVDDDGNIWTLDPWTASVSAVAGLAVVYADAACTEAWFYGTPSPGFVAGPVSDGFYVAAPDAARVDLDEGFSDFGGPCERGGVFTTDLVSAADMLEVADPGSVGAPPLHPELR